LKNADYWNSIKSMVDVKGAQPYMKGIALELPFLRLKYLKVQGYAPDTDDYRNRVTNLKQKPFSPRQSDTIQTRPNISYSSATLGQDPMKSRASVLYELTYGPSHVDMYSSTDISVYNKMKNMPSNGNIDIVV